MAPNCQDLVVNIAWISVGFDITLKHLVSSAKRKKKDIDTQSGRSLMKIANSSGPNKLPWGTPEITGNIRTYIRT